MKATVTVRNTFATDLGLLLVRLMVGAVGFFHGSQKLFSLFGGVGMKEFTAALTSMNVPQPTLSAYAAASAEFFGGILIAAGLITRIAALPFAFTMFVAAFMVHGHAFGAQDNGMEYPLTLGVVLVALFLMGPGRLSIDAVYRAQRARAKQGQA
jgi:putative oxidoreductase